MLDTFIQVNKEKVNVHILSFTPNKEAFENVMNEKGFSIVQRKPIIWTSDHGIYVITVWKSKCLSTKWHEEETRYRTFKFSVCAHLSPVVLSLFSKALEPLYTNNNNNTVPMSTESFAFDSDPPSRKPSDYPPEQQRIRWNVSDLTPNDNRATETNESETTFPPSVLVRITLFPYTRPCNVIWSSSSDCARVCSIC